MSGTGRALDWDLLYEAIRPLLSFVGDLSVVDKISISLSVLSITLSVVFFFRQRKERHPAYEIRHKMFPPEGKSFDDLAVAIRAGETNVKHLVLSKLVFLNRGKEPVRDVDLSPSDPIRWSWGGDGEILGASIVGSSRSAISPTISVGEDRKELFLDFDHLNQNDFASVEVLHTFVDHPRGEVRGSIIGVQELDDVSRRLGRRVSSLFLAMCTSWVLYIVVLIWNFIIPGTAIGPLSELATFLFMISLPIFFVAIFVVEEYMPPSVVRSEFRDWF